MRRCNQPVSTQAHATERHTPAPRRLRVDARPNANFHNCNRGLHLNVEKRPRLVQLTRPAGPAAAAGTAGNARKYAWAAAAPAGQPARDKHVPPTSKFLYSVLYTKDTHTMQISFV